MADVLAPLARSPVTPVPPLTVVDGWEVNARRADGDLLLADRTPLAKVLVRADPQGAVAASLGVPFGRAARDAHGGLVIGAGPGEWLVLTAPGTAERSVARLESAAGQAVDAVTVVDVTHGRALVRLTGARAPDVLAKVCAFDLSDGVAPHGAAVRTGVAAVVTDLVREDRDGRRSYLLHCEWSSGQYLFDALRDAGSEYGIEVDGFRSDRPDTA